MAMSLTITRPFPTDFGSRFIHDFSPRLPLVKSRFPSLSRHQSPVSSLPGSISPPTNSETMAGHHRGLPPPSAMTLPDPTRSGQPTSLTQPLGVMPTPPTQWHGQEESMRNWLVAKAEEDRRKQEEEKTRQETLKLEQRKIEQAMLRESLSSGMPPAMVPMIYAGLGGGNLANLSVEMLQQYSAELQARQQQQQQPPPPPPPPPPQHIQQAPSPDIRREAHSLGPVPAPVIAPPSQQILASQPLDPGQGQPLQTAFYAYQAPVRPAPTSAPRSATHAQLPRLTTNEMYSHPVPYQPIASAAVMPLPTQQHAHPSDYTTSSPTISFHHWVPPADNPKPAGAPQTPASRGEPHSAHPAQLSDPDSRDSPRKRKAPTSTSHHERLRPSSSSATTTSIRPPNTSPPFSTSSSAASVRGLSRVRSRSNASTTTRPDSRRSVEGLPVARLVLSSTGSDEGSPRPGAPRREESLRREDSLREEDEEEIAVEPRPRRDERDTRVVEEEEVDDEDDEEEEEEPESRPQSKRARLAEELVALPRSTTSKRPASR